MRLTIRLHAIFDCGGSDSSTENRRSPTLGSCHCLCVCCTINVHKNAKFQSNKWYLLLKLKRKYHIRNWCGIQAVRVPNDVAIILAEFGQCPCDNDGLPFRCFRSRTQNVTTKKNTAAYKLYFIFFFLQAKTGFRGCQNSLFRLGIFIFRSRDKIEEKNHTLNVKW